MANWFNADGLQVKFGDHYAEQAGRVNRARELATFGATRVIEYKYDLTEIADGDTVYTTDRDNDGTLDGFNTGDTYIPANAVVENVILYVEEAATGGTDISFGTYTKNGNSIDADGFITASDGVTANIDSAGARVAGSGADVGSVVDSLEDAYLALTVNGTYTAGKGRIIVEFVMTDEDTV